MLMVAAQNTSGFVSRGHGAIVPFVLHRPTDLATAVGLVADGAVPHAGGIDVVAELRSGRRAEQLVHLGGIEELRTIEVDLDRRVLMIGAMATHHDIETSDVIAEHRPDLQTAWRTVGNVRIRRAGTLGGNLMAGDGGYDAAPILAASGASLVWADGSTGLVTARRGATSLLTRVEVPLDGTVLFERSLKPAVSVAVGDAGVAVGCAYPDTVLLGALDGDELPPALDDAFASAGYRERMIRVLAGRLSARLGTAAEVGP